MENKFKIKKLGLNEIIKFKNWEKTLDKQDKNTRYSLLYVAPGGLINKIAKLKKCKTRKSFVLYNNKTLCGWCFYDIVNTKNNETILYINSLFINPKIQGKGYGKEFLKLILLDVVNNQKIDHVEALVDYENKLGNHFFDGLCKHEKVSAGNDFWKYRYETKNVLKNLLYNKEDREIYKN